MESTTVASLGSGIKRTGNRTGKDVDDLEGIRNTLQKDWRSTPSTVSGPKNANGGAIRNPRRAGIASPRDHEEVEFVEAAD